MSEKNNGILFWVQLQHCIKKSLCTEHTPKTFNPSPGNGLCVCVRRAACHVSTARRISLSGEGNALYPAVSRYVCALRRVPMTAEMFSFTYYRLFEYGSFLFN